MDWTFEQAGMEPRDKGQGRTVFLVKPVRKSTDGLRQRLIHTGLTTPADDQIIIDMVRVGSKLLLAAKGIRQRDLDGNWRLRVSEALEPFPFFPATPAPRRWTGEVEGFYYSGRADGVEDLTINDRTIAALRSTIGRAYEEDLDPDDRRNSAIYTHWVVANSGLIPVAFRFVEPGEVQGILVANVWEGELVSSPSMN